MKSEELRSKTATRGDQQNIADSMNISTELHDPHACFTKLKELFQEADVDGGERTTESRLRASALTRSASGTGSGGVDQSELGTLLTKFYRETKVARPPNRVKAEVVEAMAEFDEDKNGTLEVMPPSFVLESGRATVCAVVPARTRCDGG